MLRLEDREWKSFSIASVASISPGKRLTKADMLPGKTPFIGASDSCNGITEFTSNKNESEDSNVLGVNYNGSVVENFYHPYRAVFSDDVKRLHLLDHEGNQYIYLFLKTTILKQKSKYQYAYKFNEARLKRQRILLPVTPSGDPDYAFMEVYGKQLFIRKISEYEDYVREVLDEVEYKEVPLLADKKWSDFFIEDICAICSGMDIYDAERIAGNTPYISSTARNNGIGYFVNNKNTTLASGCISVNRNGSVGYSFYHPYNGLFSNDCRKLTLSEGTHFAGFFLANQISAQRGKYNYGYKMGTARLKRQKIMLPVDGNGRPDFDYMEQYAKNIYRKKIEDYLDYLGVVKASLQAQPQ